MGVVSARSPDGGNTWEAVRPRKARISQRHYPVFILRNPADANRAGVIALPGDMRGLAPQTPQPGTRPWTRC